MWRDTSRSEWNKGVKVVAMSWRRPMTWCCTIFWTQPWWWGMIPDVFIVQRILAFRNGMPDIHEHPVCIKHWVLDSYCAVVKPQGFKTRGVKVVNWESQSRALKSESQALKQAFESLESSVDAEKGNSDKRARQIHTVRMDRRVPDPRLIRQKSVQTQWAKGQLSVTSEMVGSDKRKWERLGWQHRSVWESRTFLTKCYCT